MDRFPGAPFVVGDRSPTPGCEEQQIAQCQRPQTATAITSNNGKLIDISAIYLQYREERLLRDFHAAYLLHALLTGLLLFQQLALTAYVAAVTFRQNVLAQRLDRGPRDDLPADGRRIATSNICRGISSFIFSVS